MKKQLKILFLGAATGTSLHRVDALKRLGHDVDLVDTLIFFPKNRVLEKLLSKFIYEFGVGLLEPYVLNCLKRVVDKKRYDLVWNDQSVFIGPSIMAVLNEVSNYSIAYSVDDPFGTRDKKRFSLYQKAISFYDLVVVVREPNIAEAYAEGANNVLCVWRSADEIGHRRLPIEEIEHWESEVVFIGTWMPERGPFLKKLLDIGVPLTIYGNRWEKAPEWSMLKKVWRGPGLLGTDYVKAIQSAKICLGLLSKGNRDLHTQRSAEIPYIGSVLCAERTDEHLKMYEDGVEAVFWDSPEECAEKCFSLLGNDAKRKEIAEAGHERCLQNGYLNEKVLGQIIEKVYEK